MSKPSKIDALLTRWAMPLVGEHQEWASAITRSLRRGHGAMLGALLRHDEPPARARAFIAEMAAGRVKPSRAGRPRKHGLPEMRHVWAAIQAMRRQDQI